MLRCGSLVTGSRQACAGVTEPPPSLSRPPLIRPEAPPDDDVSSGSQQEVELPTPSPLLSPSSSPSHSPSLARSLSTPMSLASS